MSVLAINGGKPEYTPDHWHHLTNESIKWPIYTQEDENAVLEVLRNRQMSGSNITKQFEKASSPILLTGFF